LWKHEPGRQWKWWLELALAQQEDTTADRTL
jgi:hypothetical protein